jgi:histidyl-tRNA synthetase
MAKRFKAPKGTFDILPGDAVARERIDRTARELFERAGYGRIETPIFEDTELFARGVGQSTDIVRKEMFSFDDLGGRMQKLPQPVKLWHLGPYFRHERPQAGRFRQFTQIGAEAIGSGSPLVDAELIMLLDELLRGLEVPALRLRLGSLGSPQGRASYREELAAYLRKNQDRLAKDVRERIDENPLRAFDSKDQGTRTVMAEAPTMLERLDADDAEHFATVRHLLEQAGIGYELDGTLVRGLDYYTRTVFAFECEQLGAQSEVGGGGRYDRLIEELDGPPTPAAGWAVGVERILLALGQEPQTRPHDVFVAAADGQRERALALVTELRHAGLRAELDLADRGLKGQMRQADRLGVAHAVILDTDGGAQLRDMSSGEQREIDLARVVEALARS